MHKHTKCKHTLKFCEHCDSVYCEACKKEWGKQSTNLLGAGLHNPIRTNPLPKPWYENAVLCASNHR